MFNHISVLKNELTQALLCRLDSGIVVDATAGGGGHTEVLLQNPNYSVIAIDRDINAIKHLQSRFEKEISAGRLIVVHSAFSKIAHKLYPHGIKRVDGIIADLGLSSVQIDTQHRGFSFQNSAPLDMRMDTSQELSAYDVVNKYPEEELVKIFFCYGEEKFSRKVAAHICQMRNEKPIETTEELAKICEKMIRSKQKIHPATRVFQAIRIEVNGELDEIKSLLETGHELLHPNGVMGVISFHSLEDKIVKYFIKSLTNTVDPILKKLPTYVADESPIEIIKPFPTKPSDQEIAENPRSRSAKLRVYKKK